MLTGKCSPERESFKILFTGENVKILSFSSRKIIDADHRVTLGNQRLAQMRTQKTSRSRHGATHIEEITPLFE